MTFWSALILGLLASAHCAGMCGGLQSVLQQPMAVRSAREASSHLLALNLGRMSTYVLGGILFSAIGTSIIAISDLPRLAQWARYLSAFVLIAIGIQLLFSTQRPFAWIEKYGMWLWNKLSPALGKKTDSARISRSFKHGFIWGFLPCGLVYSVLLTTAFSPAVLQGVLVMLGFGLGTLPAMLLTGGVYQHFRSFVRHRGVQWVGGIVFIQGGLLILFAPLLVSKDFMQAYPQLMSTFFCIE